MKKYIKLNNSQAGRITGSYDKFNGFIARYIEEDFYIVPMISELDDELGIAKSYLKKLLNQGTAIIIDMSVATDPNVIKIKKVFKETPEETKLRMDGRVTKLDYLKKTISKEL